MGPERHVLQVGRAPGGNPETVSGLPAGGKESEWDDRPGIEPCLLILSRETDRRSVLGAVRAQLSPPNMNEKIWEGRNVIMKGVLGVVLKGLGTTAASVPKHGKRGGKSWWKPKLSLELCSGVYGGAAALPLLPQKGRKK